MGMCVGVCMGMCVGDVLGRPEQHGWARGRAHIVYIEYMSDTINFPQPLPLSHTHTHSWRSGSNSSMMNTLILLLLLHGLVNANNFV